MVAPTPITMGAAVVTGAVYGVATIVDNRKALKEFPGKVADTGAWASERISGGFGKVADGAKALGSALNPFDQCVTAEEATVGECPNLRSIFNGTRTPSLRGSRPV
ncbi:hypothetical protein GCM10010294_45990 [Streptomyces griseoloalbus]|nr:hypothetical protein GCM10010294_45990 [Streptomyces griseoloalbus]